MGCDIHMFTEVRKKGVWVHADKISENPYYKDSESEYYENRFESSSIYSDRNYSLFSILANIRNRSKSLLPITEPKGMPANASPFVVKEYKYWSVNGHSHSYFSIKEIDDFLYINPEKKAKKLLLQEPLYSLPNHVVEPLEHLLELMKNHMPGNPEDGRIVFWFDN